MWPWNVGANKGFSWAGREGHLRLMAQPRPCKNLLGLTIGFAVFIILLMHVTVLPLYEIVPGLSLSKNRVMGDHELDLCDHKLKLKPVSLKRVCPSDGIVTVAQGGRLGNQMWEYASVWAVARHTGLEPFVPRCLRSVLDDVFSQLSVPDMGGIAHCSVPLDDAVHAPENWTRINQSIVLPRFLFLEEKVLTWVNDIRREFKFRTNLEAKAQSVLQKASGQRTNVTFVGVHVRRTDYMNYLWRTRHVGSADETFYKKAISYFRTRYHPVVFIIASDDASWCRKHLSGSDNVLVSGRGSSAGQDLAILAACNHSIIDYGTYGVWGAILAGGETVLYNIAEHSSIRVAKLLPQWQVFSWQNATNEWKIEPTEIN